MKSRTNIVAPLLVCSFFVVLGIGSNYSAHADDKIPKTEPTIHAKNIHGKITDVFVASVYTYAEVDTGEMKVWAAGPVTPLKKGDMISFSTKMPMKNFHSESMNRDFPVIYFVDSFITTNETSARVASETASPHSQIKQKQVANPVKGIKKVDGGNTIAEINTNKDDFKGKTIKVRGKVTKFNSNILGKNWLHIMDSSTGNDLTVTTNDSAAIGDVVVVEGKLELDKDYGYGYVYPIIIEDARITKK